MDRTLLSTGDQEISLVPAVTRLLIPPLLAFSYFSVCFLILPYESSLILGGLMILYYIPPAGKESIIPLGIALGIPWWLMAISLALLDVLTGLFMILNFRIALRIPVLGPWISSFFASGADFMKKRPWLARWRVLGVAFFVWLPLQGTGGVGATLVGMMASLTPEKILLAIGIGAAAECLMFALGSELIWQLILTNLYLGVGVGIVVVTIGILGVFLYQRRMGL